jgi:hypothetical protein
MMMFVKKWWDHLGNAVTMQSARAADRLSSSPFLVLPDSLTALRPYSARVNSPGCQAAAAVSSVDFSHRKSLPSHHIRCSMTASLRATATSAFFIELRLAIRMPHAFNEHHRLVLTINECAASKRCSRAKASPHRVMRLL